MTHHLGTNFFGKKIGKPMSATILLRIDVFHCLTCYALLNTLITILFLILLYKFFLWQSLEFLIWLIMIWLQMLLILTKSVNRCFEKNPKFDMTPLLGGTDVVFSSLIHSFSWFVSLFPFGFWNSFVVTPALGGGNKFMSSILKRNKNNKIFRRSNWEKQS